MFWANKSQRKNIQNKSRIFFLYYACSSVYLCKNPEFEPQHQKNKGRKKGRERETEKGREGERKGGKEEEKKHFSSFYDVSAIFFILQLTALNYHIEKKFQDLLQVYRKKFPLQTL